MLLFFFFVVCFLFVVCYLLLILCSLLFVVVVAYGPYGLGPSSVENERATGRRALGPANQIATQAAMASDAVVAPESAKAKPGFLFH